MRSDDQGMMPLGTALRVYVDQLVQQQQRDGAPPTGVAGVTATALCPRCHNARYLVADAPVGDPRFGTLIRCPCARPTQRRDLTDAIQATRGARTTCTLTGFALNRPLSLLHTRGRTVTIPEQRHALQQCYDAVAAFIACPNRPWLYLFGPTGSGKSHLALAIYHALADHGAGVLTAAGLLAYLRTGVETHAADARLQAVQHLPLLILDDMGTEEPTAWGLARLYDVIEYRSVQGLPTVITANIPLDDLSALSTTLDDRVRWARIISRIAQHITAPLAVLASDYRRLHWGDTPF